MSEGVGLEVVQEPKWLLLLSEANEDWPRQVKTWLGLAAIVAK